MWQTFGLTLLAAVFGVNAVPHFLKGVTKEPFPTPFGPSPVVNVVAGWFMFCLAGLIATPAGISAHPWYAAAGGALGALLMSLFHATIGAFGRSTPRGSASTSAAGR